MILTNNKSKIMGLGKIFIASFLTLIVFIFSIYIFFFPDSFTLKLETEFSDVCQLIKNSPTKTYLDEQICKNEFTKKKFILLILDGIAFP